MKKSDLRRWMRLLILISLLTTPALSLAKDPSADCSAASITYWANRAFDYKLNYWLFGYPICTNKTQKKISKKVSAPCWYSCGRVASVILKKAGCNVRVTSDAGALWKRMEKQFEYSEFWQKGCLIGLNSVDLGRKGKQLERLGPRQPRGVAYRHVGVTVAYNSFVDNGGFGGVKRHEGYSKILGRSNYHAPLFLCPKH